MDHPRRVVGKDEVGMRKEKGVGSGVLILRHGVRRAARGLASGVKSSEILPA
jgi:hypothetical protein